MNRGARHLPVFGDDHDRSTFLNLWAEAVSTQELKVHAYALMGNHFHLLVEAGVDALSSSMKRVAGAYTRRFNVKYGFDGPLFRGRYRSKPITDERYLATVVRYIHRNPLSTDAVHAAELEWTSHPAYVGDAGEPRWLTTAAILQRFGGSRAAFDEFVLAGSAEPGRRLDRRRLVRTRTPDDIEAALGVGSATELEVIRSGGRGLRNDTRLAALLLANKYCNVELLELSDRYGYRDAHVARSAIARARVRLESDRGFGQLVRDAEMRLRIGDLAA